MATFTKKLKNLFIPKKVMDATDARAIENWVSGDLAKFLADLVAFINAGGGVTFYASLTGPGKTSPTGALEQGGDFQIDGNTQLQANFTGPGTGATATFNWTVDSGPIILSTGTAGAGTVTLTGAGVGVTCTNATDKFTVTADTHSVFVAGTDGGGTPVLGFFGIGPVAKQSSAGVTTVAQLVTILQNYGLLS
jgi:hypothetical protein